MEHIWLLNISIFLLCLIVVGFVSLLFTGRIYLSFDSCLATDDDVTRETLKAVNDVLNGNGISVNSGQAFVFYKKEYAAEYGHRITSDKGTFLVITSKDCLSESIGTAIRVLSVNDVNVNMGYIVYLDLHTANKVFSLISEKKRKQNHEHNQEREREAKEEKEKMLDAIREKSVDKRE